MATVVKRLLTVCLALAFLVGVTEQLMPSSMAEPQTTASAQMGGSGCDDPHPPCTGHMPTCLDHGGCISGSVLPTLPAAVAVPIEWTSLNYNLVAQALSGISVRPELSPPILAV
jgi:hypothetical protein